MMASQPEEPFDNRMTDDELAAYLATYADNTVGLHDDTIAEDQERAIDYYYRRMPDLPAQDGCSSVVDGTVAIVIDNALASILKPFVSSDETVSFAPRGPEDTEIAEQATEYANYVFNCDNPGFIILHDWFKDALLSKLGIVKCWWEEKIERQQVIATNEIALAQLRNDPRYAGEQETDGGWLVDLIEDVDGRVRIVNIPPEEFEVGKFTRSIAEAEYLAHVPRNTTRSDLVEMGFDPELVESLATVGANKSAVWNEGREQARWQDEDGSGSVYQLGTPHESQELVEIRDEYVRIDFDGDGIAELRRVIRSDTTILLNEETDYIPFATLCPVPMPHKVYGLSLADQVIDLQRISTAIWRQTLDNLYKTNNPRPIIGEGFERMDGSTQETIADSAPGAAVLGRDLSQFRYDSVPFFAKESFGMLEYVEGQQEARTGIARTGQGMDPNALQGPMTATEVAQISAGRNARAEMIARIFAETGVKDLFSLILRLLVTYQPKERMVRLRNKWVEVDPSAWPEMDVEISVGLGMGDKTEKLAAASAIMQDYAIIAQSPFAHLVTDKNVYNAFKMKLNAADIKNVDDFVEAPQEGQEQPERPSPEEMKAQGELQLQQAKMQAEQQMQAMKLEAQREEAALKQQLAREEAEFEAQLAIEKMEREFALAEQKLQMEERLASRRAAMSERESEAKMSTNRPGGDLDK